MPNLHRFIFQEKTITVFKYSSLWFRHFISGYTIRIQCLINYITSEQVSAMTLMFLYLCNCVICVFHYLKKFDRTSFMCSILLSIRLVFVCYPFLFQSNHLAVTVEITLSHLNYNRL